MANSKYLSAYTPAQFSYPPFVNFTQVGGFVRVMVREAAKPNEEKGYDECGQVIEMYLPVTDARELFATALENLDENAR